MTYYEFKEKLKICVQERLGSETEVYITILQKGNACKTETLSFKKKGCNLLPVIHLKDMYERYLENQDMNWCIHMVLAVYNTKAYVEKEQIFKDWSCIKEALEIQLINEGWNRERLIEVPYKKFLDLALVCRIKVCDLPYGNASYMVTNKMLAYWGISEGQLWDAAERILNKEEFMILSMGEVIAVLTETELPDKALDNQLLVMTNRKKVNGAVGMLRTDLLQRTAEKYHCNFYILPSSTHEVILVPDNVKADKDVFREMIIDVNEQIVAEEERLSNHAYYYNCHSNTVQSVL